MTSSSDSPHTAPQRSPHTGALLPSAQDAGVSCCAGRTGRAQDAHGTAEAAKDPAQKYTEAVLIGDEEYTPMVCSMCDWGGYTPVPGQYALGGPVYACTADGCEHTVDASAFDLDAGERLTVHHGRLHVARRSGDTPA